MARTSTWTTTASPSQHFRPPPRSAPTASYAETFGAGSGAAAFAAEHFASIPGLRTSAAFLSSLGANLRIPDTDLLPSPLHTPSLRPSRESLNTHPAPPSPPAQALYAASETSLLSLPPSAMSSTAGANAQSSDAQPADVFADIPPLSTFIATDETTEIIPALKLIADSIAQQRQTAARVLISHPLNIAVVIGFLASLFNYLYKHNYDKPTQLMVLGGVSMSILALVRYSTREYIFAAEGMKYEWLGEDDSVIVTKYGNEIIGAAIIRWDESSATVSSGGKRRPGKNSNIKGVLRAWTVRLRYRRKGVGRALLEEAVDLVRSKGGEELEVAEDHANSLRFLPDLYNRLFDKRDAKARVMVREVVEEKKAAAGAQAGKKR